MYTYTATCINVVDGDTVDLVVDLGFKLFQRSRFRLAGIDTPEKGQLGYKEATDFLSQLVLGKTLTLRSEKVSKYGYYLAHLTLKDGTDVTAALINAGHGRSYSGGSKQ